MTKDEALNRIGKLPDVAIVRIAELSENPKARSYFTNYALFQMIKGFLKI